MGLHERAEDEEAPEAEDDAGNGGEEIEKERDRTGEPAGGKLS